MPGKNNGTERTKLLFQALALIAVVIMVVLNQQNDPDIPSTYILPILGLALGARPETVNEILAAVLTGRKK